VNGSFFNELIIVTEQWAQHIPVDWIAFIKLLVQFAILLFIIQFLYQRFIQKSQAEQLLRGLFLILLIFVLLWAISRLLDFQILALFLTTSIQLLVLGMIVIFQPELRRILSTLGQGDFLGKKLMNPSSQQDIRTDTLISELIEAVRFLSKSKTGALIVLEMDQNTEATYLEAGTVLDAHLSTELLLTIFQHRAPLHDGAVVINAENRIASAGVLLPLTEDPNLSWRHGTRHRAAIGLTELSQSKCIVVSEESGSISFVENGTLTKLHHAEDLRQTLETVYFKGGGNSTPSAAAKGIAVNISTSTGWLQRPWAWIRKRAIGQPPAN
jgi:diadenylate cyclase